MRSAVSNRTRGKRCSYCAGQSAVAGVSDIATLFPELVARIDFDFHDPEIATGLMQNSDKVLHWKCPEGHVWTRRLRNEVRSKGCKVCGGRFLIAGTNDLASVFPEIASQWDSESNGTLAPSEVTARSPKIVGWKCPRGHTWRTSVSHRTVERTGCPYCSNHKCWPGFNDVATLFPALTAELDPIRNAGVDLGKTLWTSRKKLFWLCSVGHQWSAQVSMRTRGGGVPPRPTGCPSCASSGFSVHDGAELYLIEHFDFGAFKIGITNKDKSRIDAWAGRGWVVHRRWLFETGVEARLVENEVLNLWIRDKLHLPEFLGKEEVGKLGGNTETFSNEAVTVHEVIGQVEESIARLQAKTQT